MSGSDPASLRFPPDAGGDPRLGAPPRLAVRLAAAVIVALAFLGLIRGAISSRPLAPGALPLAVLAGLTPAASAAAKAAVILPRDDLWSTLSGPRMIDAAEKAKAQAKPAESDDEDAASDSAAAQTAAADAMIPDAPDAPDAAPTPPAASSSAPTSPN
jgi:hypothetical protein